MGLWVRCFAFLVPSLVVLVGCSTSVPKRATHDRCALNSPARFESTAHVSNFSVLPEIDGKRGYQIAISHQPFQLQIVRDNLDVLETTLKWPKLLVPDSKPEKWASFSSLSTIKWVEDTGTLQLELISDVSNMRMSLSLRPCSDSIDARLSVTQPDARATLAEIAFSLGENRSWYGHGEFQNTAQPWPLNSGSISDDQFSPSSYKMIEPYWYHSGGVALWFGANKFPLSVHINAQSDGLVRVGTKEASSLDFEIILKDDTRTAYHALIDRVGGPKRSQAPFEHFQSPAWNTWAQFYTGVTQEKILKYAADLRSAKLPGHTVQIDDRWESNYGDFDFDGSKFPSPKSMVHQLSTLGFKTGIWVTLWVSPTSKNYEWLSLKGYLLKDKKNTSHACQVTWWNGNAGIIDLGNSSARAWLKNQLTSLQERFGISGFKFDTRFFDDRCATYRGTESTDYMKLGAELANSFDLQGVGVRLHWGMQPFGFVTRQLDKSTDWKGLQTAIRQLLALSSVGYPFLATDMIGGSLFKNPPKKDVLVRWAQAAALTPVMYASTSPLGATHPQSGITRTYDSETIRLFRSALLLHARIAPYIWKNVQESIRSGAPVMRPLSYEFPQDSRALKIWDQWMLGEILMAAPLLTLKRSRDIYLPAGSWVNAGNGKAIQGPKLLKRYSADLSEIPAFVRVDKADSAELLEALRPQN